MERTGHVLAEDAGFSGRTGGAEGVCCAGGVLCRAHANQSNKLPGLSDLLVSQKNNQLIN